MNIPKMIQEMQGQKLVMADLLTQKETKQKEIEEIDKKLIEISGIIKTLEIIIRTNGFENTPEKEGVQNGT